MSANSVEKALPQFGPQIIRESRHHLIPVA